MARLRKLIAGFVPPASAFDGVSPDVQLAWKRSVCAVFAGKPELFDASINSLHNRILLTSRIIDEILETAV